MIHQFLMEFFMARTASGVDVLERARQAIISAQTVEQLRQAQAVVLPLDYGLSIDQVAEITGLSRGWTCQLRRRFIAGHPVSGNAAPARGGRRRENLGIEQEREFLAPFLEKASAGGILVVGEIRVALEQRLGRSVALASVYNLLHRHNWRKLAPDKHHPQSDPEAQLEWKKNSQKSSVKSAKVGQKRKRSN